jgi:phosphoribosylformylglycinamidine cyclo-ligase
VSEEPLTYGSSGVDLEAARKHTSAIADLVAGGVTGFAGEVPLPPMEDPVVLAATDGVGTKVLLAVEHGLVDGLGQDLVAMCVNDLACAGAQPLAFLDYMAMGKLDPELAPRIVRSIAVACDAVDCALIGGETAEMPGLYSEGHFDLAGFAIGAVERSELLGPHRTMIGDVIVGIPSSGLHSNGFSLVRRLLGSGALDAGPEVLLEPTRLYSGELLRLREAKVDVHAAAHITGGGLPENLPRALGANMRAVIDTGSWARPEAIEAVLASERMDPEDAWGTFNMGLGMCLVLPPDAADAATELVTDARIVGEIESGEPGVTLAR